MNKSLKGNQGEFHEDVTYYLEQEIHTQKNRIKVEKLLCQNMWKGKPYTQEAVNRVIRYIIKACNEQEQDKALKENREPILLPRFSAHTLRHTFCTRFCENESNIKVIQQIMGHSRIDTTMDIYTHVTKNKADEVMQNLSGKIKIC